MKGDIRKSKEEEEKVRKGKKEEWYYNKFGMRIKINLVEKGKLMEIEIGN